ncbi:tetratricopeptide repeat protein [Gulosibacter sp. 10]|uniref:tetratricopeptide repeat protein n=1 Tax=Gulosibacter sp. 10 TaxID=1255570 RepID=UPI00097F4DEF|nr:tetratricopeptide repeat protein [Gulosibacter sp. 10]SJM52133.1 Thioredoxin domain-containing protein EC-YbbN [Gulosibacter sp. 10]
MTDPNNVPMAAMGGGIDLSGLAQRHQQQAAQAGQNGQAEGPEGQGDAIALPDVVIEGGPEELEQFSAHSQRIPVLVQVYSESDPDSTALGPVLADIVRSAEGRLVLLRIDADAYPELGGQTSVLALVGGRPLPLFQGNPPQQQIAQVLNELLQVAAQQGLTGQVQITGEPQEAPAPKPLPPLHQEAQDALQRGDVEAAKSAYERQLAESPADDDAKIGLAQVNLLVRLQDKTLQEIRDRAAQHPEDVDAQLDVADLDLSGGHVDDAFARLLGLFPKLDAADKTRVRERLLELFDVAGPEDGRVVRARQRLTSLLFS